MSDFRPSILTPQILKDFKAAYDAMDAKACSEIFAAKADVKTTNDASCREMLHLSRRKIDLK